MHLPTTVHVKFMTFKHTHTLTLSKTNSCFVFVSIFLSVLFRSISFLQMISEHKLIIENTIKNDKEEKQEEEEKKYKMH